MLKLNFVVLAAFALSIFHIRQTLALECYVCDNSDPNCLNDVTKLAPKQCESDDFTLCTTQIDGTSGNLSRACAKADAKCSTGNCRSCSEEKCNTHNICKTCNDAQCAQTNAANSKSEVCPASDTKCLININTNKQTERRCATADDVTACTDQKTCVLSAGANSNIGIFPENRKRCYQCDASIDAKCNNIAANIETLQTLPCVLYDADEKCYTFGTSETTMARGCVSDTADSNKCKTPTSNELCLACDQDNCNNHNYKFDQNLLCIKCVSSQDNTDCMWGQSANKAMNCANQIVYNKPQQCYTESKDGNVTRGCMVDRTSESACNSENSCEVCSSGNGCNNMDKADFTCKVCRSDEDSRCWKEAKDLTGKPCRNPVTKAEGICFAGVWNDVIIRGCLVDGDERLQAVCKEDGNKQCESCTGKDCNIAERSSAAITTVNIALVGIVLLHIGKFFY